MVPINVQGNTYKYLPIPNDISPMIDDMGLELVERMKDGLKAEDKVWRGHARDSIDYDKHNTTVYSDLIYVYNIEFGRKPGSLPPYAPLKQWVKSKLGIDELRAHYITQLIRYNIQKKGISETRFTKKAIMGMISPTGMPIITHKRRTTKLTSRQKFLRMRLAADQRIARSWKRQNRLQKRLLRQHQSAAKKKIAAHKRKVRAFKSRSKKVQKSVRKFGAMKSFTRSKGRKFGGKF